MQRAKSPNRLWDYCGEWVTAIHRLTAHDIPSLHDRVPCKAVESNTSDISEYAKFDRYQYVWYHDPAVQFPEDPKKLGRWIGVADDVGSLMTFWILPASCRVLARLTVFTLSQDEMDDPQVKSKLVQLDLAVAEKIGNDGMEVTKDGSSRPRRTTNDWKLLVAWKAAHRRGYRYET
jgi:hypothetical protein